MIQRPRLLAIDDDPDYRKWLRHVLRSRFFVVDAADGPDGYSRALSSGPHIVLIDYQMEGWDGLFTLRKFRDDPQLKDLPIVMLTGDAQRETVLEAIQAGATSYVLKSTATKESLSNKLLTLLNRQDEE
ncbi:MAG: response regulator [Planctomycetaceae bacterium]|nr:response regulator [Planctomycetaceae bacterium]